MQERTTNQGQTSRAQGQRKKTSREGSRAERKGIKKKEGRDQGQREKASREGSKAEGCRKNKGGIKGRERAPGKIRGASKSEKKQKED